MLFKVFVDRKPSELETAMNNWTAENPDIKIRQICSSESQGAEGFGVSVIIMYEQLVPVQ